AISERMDLKLDLYGRVIPHLGERAVLASNTSGLSINALSESFPESLRKRFCGVHFFNPPRYMHLVELIPGRETDPAILDGLETFLVTSLGKGVVRARDTPNFIGNRVGVFSLLATLYHAERLGLGFDIVDALTGALIGRPRSATFRTADVVGLDVFAHVVQTMKDGLPGDPWHRYYTLPAWLQTLIANGALGQKTRRGVYQKVGKEIHVLDLATSQYRPASTTADETVAEIMKERDVRRRFARLHESDHPQAQLLWAIHRDTFHYCAFHLAGIAQSARDVDFALRWGFGWERGPFELWQAAGWQQIRDWVNEDIAAGRSMSHAPVPAWASEPQRSAVHGPQGSYAPSTGGDIPRSALPVYRRQPFPDRLLGEPAEYGETIFENEGMRCWHAGDGIAVASFKTRMHTIGDEVLDGLLYALDEAERNYAGLVIWQTEPPFSAGANLKAGGSGSSVAQSATGKRLKQLGREAESLVLKAARQLGVADLLMAGRLNELEALVVHFQQTTQRFRYAMVPTIAAIDGLALGGGCELAMHCARIVATLESYVGLVEAGIGLLPAGGGCKELALRAAAQAAGDDLFPRLRKSFQTVAMAEVSRSAEHARELGYLREADTQVMNRFELLHVAKCQLRALAEAGYRPPLRPAAIPVAGRSAIATLTAHLVNLREGGRISEHDYLIGEKIATVLCGGDVDAGSLVNEQWLLDLERRHFIELVATEKTQARIAHTLKTGKPLRN
ncbi:MAG TPA: 3-hydroxyacyl-CoA dehydrogenase/enoyl-CoA hydratase family protein, partial [Burkholderiales bacterium]|nr:3-hydroxyacyl-CoA dehydrogenase/enoyl-CoA hydratase family protein [Burkholderiales bacterium]